MFTKSFLTKLDVSDLEKLRSEIDQILSEKSAPDKEQTEDEKCQEWLKKHYLKFKNPLICKN